MHFWRGLREDWTQVSHDRAVGPMLCVCLCVRMELMAGHAEAAKP